MAPLMQLPAELGDRICSYLSPKDIQQFRLVSRELDQKSERQFAMAYFRTTRFMLTRESLETLIEIAKKPKYGPRIKKLELSLVRGFEEHN